MRKMKEANMTFVEDAVGVKTIDPNSDTCCDIYILLDMSKSMTEDDFNNSRMFIKTLLPEVCTETNHYLRHIMKPATAL